MNWADGIAVFLFLSLLVYVLFGGADFGGGIWDLLAFGPRAKEQRRAIENAIAPVWEANHVWLIIALVLLFTGFPPAFAAVSEALHIPLELLLLGIVLRGSAFVFRHYGADGPLKQVWGRIFASASFMSAIFLGMCFGSLTAADIPAGTEARLRYTGWLAPFPLMVGGMTLSVFAFLAAVYLAHEVQSLALKRDFRLRAFVSGGAIAVFAVGAAQLIPHRAVAFTSRFESLAGLRWVTAAAAVLTFILLWKEKYRLARAAAIAEVVLLFLVWGVAQYPVLVSPALTLNTARSSDAMLRPLFLSLCLGALLIVPSLLWLLKIFKSQRSV